MHFLQKERDSTENLCAEGEFHYGSSTNNQHVPKLAESWSEMTLAIGDLDVHSKLCAVDVRSNEIFYTKNLLSQFHNRYRATQAKKDDVQTNVKRFFSKHMRGDKFQTKYINQMNSS